MDIWSRLPRFAHKHQFLTSFWVNWYMISMTFMELLNLLCFSSRYDRIQYFSNYHPLYISRVGETVISLEMCGKNYFFLCITFSFTRLLFQDRDFFGCNTGWAGTCFVYQVGLKFTEIPLSLYRPPKCWEKSCATMPGYP